MIPAQALTETIPRHPGIVLGSTQKSWITVSASEIVTGDITDNGRVSSVTRKGDFVLLTHDGGADITIKSDLIEEVYR